MPPVLVTVSVVSFSIELSIAFNVPVLVTCSLVMSSSPPLASSVPELVMLGPRRRVDRQRAAGRFQRPRIGDAGIGDRSWCRSSSASRRLLTVPPVIVALDQVDGRAEGIRHRAAGVGHRQRASASAIESSIACSVPVLVTPSLVMSSAPPLASSVPELVMLGPAIAIDRQRAAGRFQRPRIGDPGIGDEAGSGRVESDRAAKIVELAIESGIRIRS